MLNQIEYRIMGIPSRMGNIHYLQKTLSIPDDKIFLDVEYRHNPMWTWKNTARLNNESGVTHLCIIQDDAVLSDRFNEFCYRLVNKYPDAIMLLFNAMDMSKRLPYYCICQPGFCTGGVVLLVPLKYIDSIIKEQEEQYPDYRNDDNWLMYWAYHHDIKVIVPFPSVVDTLDGTALNHDGKKAFKFCKDPMNHHWANATEHKYSSRNKYEKPKE